MKTFNFYIKRKNIKTKQQKREVKKVLKGHSKVPLRHSHMVNQRQTVKIKKENNYFFVKIRKFLEDTTGSIKMIHLDPLPQELRLSARVNMKNTAGLGQEKDSNEGDAADCKREFMCHFTQS